MIRGVLFSALALALLGIDFALFPHLVEDEVAVDALNASSLVNGEVVTMGKYRLHTVRVSRGRVADEAYTAKLGKVSGVAMSAFSATRETRVSIASFSNAVISLLPSADGARVTDLIRSTPTFTPGKVQLYRLSAPVTEGPLSGVQVLLILRTQRGNDREAKEALRAGLVQLFEAAAKSPVEALLMPVLSVDPDEKESPSFDDFFRFLFEALPQARFPRVVDLSFFDGWSTASLENATAAFNAQWSAQTRARGNVPTLHRFQLRLLLVGLAVCFIVCGRQVEINLRSASVLATAYVLMLLGAFKTVETLMEGLPDAARDAGLVAVALVLAAFFPHVVRWSAKDLFAAEGANGQR